MRWFFGGVIIGLLILELKVLGGCGHIGAIAQTSTAGAAAAAAVPAARGKCSCSGAIASVVQQSIAPAQAKVILSSPSNFGNRVEPPAASAPTLFGINPEFAVF
jgi:hypothetical protein